MPRLGGRSGKGLQQSYLLTSSPNGGASGGSGTSTVPTSVAVLSADDEVPGRDTTSQSGSRGGGVHPLPGSTPGGDVRHSGLSHRDASPLLVEETIEDGLPPPPPPAGTPQSVPTPRPPRSTSPPSSASSGVRRTQSMSAYSRRGGAESPVGGGSGAREWGASSGAALPQATPPPPVVRSRTMSGSGSLRRSSSVSSSTHGGAGGTPDMGGVRRRLRLFNPSEDGEVLPTHMQGQSNHHGGGADHRRSAGRSSSSSHGGLHGYPGQATVSIPLGYLVHGLFLLTILYIMLDSKNKVDLATEQLAFYKEEESRVNAKIVEFESRAAVINEEVSRLRQDNAAMERIKKDRQEKLAQYQQESDLVDNIQREQAKLRDKDMAIREQVVKLQERIQTESRREAIEKFGEGPHQVEIALDFPGPKQDSKGTDLPHIFRVEMAPLSLMPHSVQLFLEQVSHGLWVGSAFVWNPAHLILAAPHARMPEGTDSDAQHAADEAKRDEFGKAGFASVSFQEYSEDFPHKKWTVGFAGRPGGPNFYVNMQDNVRVHGPGGQTHGDLSEEDADPCFGKVVAGYETLERLHALPNEEDADGWKKNAFRENVYIKYAKIIPTLE